jgi:hypothetical protein
MISCGSYCEHGGICELPKGHEGLHDSRYCQWDDAHALTEWEADQVLSQAPGGTDYLDFKNSLGVTGLGLA